MYDTVITRSQSSNNFNTKSQVGLPAIGTLIIATHTIQLELYPVKHRTQRLSMEKMTALCYGEDYTKDLISRIEIVSEQLPPD